MAAFVIHYDLNKGDRKDYQRLYEALLESKGVRATESTWFLSTSWDAIQVRDWLRNFMHEKDALCVNVLSVDSGYASSNLPQEAVQWMSQHLVTQRVGVRT